MRLWREIELILKESSIPVSTPDLVLLVGDRPNARRQVWDALVTMARAGIVCRTVRVEKRDIDDRFKSSRKVAYWSLVSN